MKLVHKLMFSMPAGMPPQKVLEAVKTLAREEFALKHRYVMVLHTNEPHPHVHMVLKAVSEQGGAPSHPQGNVAWLETGIRAAPVGIGSAGECDGAGSARQNRSPKLDGIYRADQRGDSWRTRSRVDEVGRELLSGRFRN